MEKRHRQQDTPSGTDAPVQSPIPQKDPSAHTCPGPPESLFFTRRDQHGPPGAGTATCCSAPLDGPDLRISLAALNTVRKGDGWGVLGLR